MNFNNFKKSIYKSIIFSLLISFLLLLNTFPAFAETVEYTYDSAHQIEKATYGNEITVEYTYDSSGNRITKTVMIDTDADGIFDDGDRSGIIGDSPCTGGNTINCDDNCPNAYNPYQADSDGDRIGDACDPCINDPALICGGDTDNDGMSNSFEVRYDLDPDNPADASMDKDGDGLTNLIEYQSGTNPLSPDTDADGILDGNDNCPLNPPVKIAGTYYSTLQSAYDAAQDGETIQSHAVTLTENLNINLSKSVTLEGGYNCDYTSNTGNTELKGTMRISGGTVKVKNFILKK